MVTQKKCSFANPDILESEYSPFAATTVEHKMAEPKTRKNTASVDEFIESVANATRRDDAWTVLRLMRKVTGKKPRMWGASIIGFDEYHYRYESGHEGDMCMIGFSPRASALTLYILPDFKERAELLGKLGKHKEGKGCLYISKLADVDLEVLEEIISSAYAWMRKNQQAKN